MWLSRGLTERLHRYATEGSSPLRQSAAIGLGVCIGCLPAIGFHFPLCVVTGWSLGLNRLKMYAAANISNPLFLPFLLFGSVQLGALLLEGRVHSMTVESFRSANPWAFGEQLIVGSVALGTGLGSVAFAGTYWLLTRIGLRRDEADLLEEVARRFLSRGISSWASASFRLRTNPMYRSLLTRELLPTRGRFVHWNCGMGLPFALLRVAERARDEGRLPSGWSAPEDGLELVGFEESEAALASARGALADGSRLERKKARLRLPPSDLVLLERLHESNRNEQERVVAAACESLVAGGVLLLYEPSMRGISFRGGRLLERLRDFTRGRFRERRHYRSNQEWLRVLNAAGLETTVVTMNTRTHAASAFIRGLKR